MKAFEDKAFDCQFGSGKDSHRDIANLMSVTRKGYYTSNSSLFLSKVCRPRLNHAQDLPGWQWVPDGFIWSAKWVNRIADEECTEAVNSERLREIADHDLHFFISAACIGLEQGYELEGMKVCGVSA
jgi:hypothetical protein